MSAPVFTLFPADSALGSAIPRRPSWISFPATRQPSRPPAPPSVPPSILPSTPPQVIPAAPSDPPASVRLTRPGPTQEDMDALATELAQLRYEKEGLVARLAELAVAMGRQRSEILAASEPQLVQLALAIAGRIVGRELTTDPTLVVEWAREALDGLDAALDRRSVVIALAKEGLPEVPAEAWTAAGPEARVEVDVQLAPGHVEVRAGGSVVESGAAARTEAVARSLHHGQP